MISLDIKRYHYRLIKKGKSCEILHELFSTFLNNSALFPCKLASVSKEVNINACKISQLYPDSFVISL